MKKAHTPFRKWLRTFVRVDRDARYVVALLWAVPLFILTFLQAVNAGWFDSVEKPIFHFFNHLPSWMGGPMYIITQMGSLTGLLLWMGLAWYWTNRRAALSVFIGGNVGWILAKVVKMFVHRGRPGTFIEDINLFQNHIYSGYGFPSGHSTFSAACVTVLYYQVRPMYRKYLLLAVILVGISRMYLGAHFPLDIVGGWALGVISGSLVMLLMGSSAKFISGNTIKKALEHKGYGIRSVRFINVDARGSRPVYIEDTAGRHYFGKVFGEKEHAADWLFKTYRFFRYKNLQAEEPYLNGRRNIELESFATLWAKKVGVRAAGVMDIIRIGRHWLLIQEKVDAKPLPDFKRLTTATLEDAWRQVMKLHDGNMAHRDLRAANLMVDTAGKVWIIDFGFAEVSPNNSRKSMDIAELLMSMALVVGVERTVAAAVKIVGKDKLRHALLYLHRSVFSGATNSQLKKQKTLLKELQDALKQQLRVTGDVKPADIDRLNAKKLITIVLFAIFAYVIIPQFTQFRGALEQLDNVRLGWLLPVFLFSLLTYVAAGAVFVALANVPLSLRDSSLVQLAASFMSKIVPGGMGSTSLNARYLVKSGLDATESSALLVGQSVIGFIMFVVPLSMFLFVNGQNISSIFHFHIKMKIFVGILVALMLVSVIIFTNSSLRNKVREFVARFISQLRDLSTSPRELGLAAFASLAITAGYVGCLYASIHALHGTLGIGTAIIVYASAMIAKSAVPTPGGLGPVEVAMSAALIGSGLPSGQAFAIVILYRLATFWLPIPFSLIAYRYITSKNIV